MANMQTLQVKFKPSNQLTAIFIGVMLFACMMLCVVIWLVDASMRAQFGWLFCVLSLMIVLMCAYVIGLHARLSWPWACQALLVNEAGMQILRVDGQCLSVLLLPGSFVSPHLTVLHLKTISDATTIPINAQQKYTDYKNLSRRWLNTTLVAPYRHYNLILCPDKFVDQSQATYRRLRVWCRFAAFHATKNNPNP